MVDSHDWRLQGQEKYLKGATLVRRLYREYLRNPGWDHDHCEFCWAKFMLRNDPDVLHEGYCTLDEHRWICDQCFSDFSEMFDWKLAAIGLSQRAAIELHDSEISAITTENESIRVKFRNAYVHRSLGVPGEEPGTGWSQPADLVLRGATTVTSITTPAIVWDGAVIVNERRLQNVIPVPLNIEGTVVLEIEFNTGQKLDARGTGIALEFVGEATYVEDFGGARESESSSEPQD